MRGTILVGRVLFSILFITAGFGHFNDATIAFADRQGVPYAGLLVPLSGLLAILGGLSILLGYRAKIGAWMIALFLVPVTFKMHAFWMIADPAEANLQQIMFFKNLAMLGGALTFAYFGSGPYSIDSRIETSDRTPVGATTSLAGTVIPSSLRQEGETERAAREALKANESSRLTGMW